MFKNLELILGVVVIISLFALWVGKHDSNEITTENFSEFAKLSGSMEPTEGTKMFLILKDGTTSIEVSMIKVNFDHKAEVTIVEDDGHCITRMTPEEMEKYFAKIRFIRNGQVFESKL